MELVGLIGAGLTVVVGDTTRGAVTCRWSAGAVDCRGIVVERVTIRGEAGVFSGNAKDTEDQKEEEIGDGVPDVGVPDSDDASLVADAVLASESAVGEPAHVGEDSKNFAIPLTAAGLTVLRLLPGAIAAAAWVLSGEGKVAALCKAGCGSGGRTLISIGKRNARGLCCEPGIRTAESFSCRCCCCGGCVSCRHTCGCLLRSEARRSRTSRKSSSLVDTFISELETK